MLYFAASDLKEGRALTIQKSLTHVAPILKPRRAVAPVKVSNPGDAAKPFFCPNTKTAKSMRKFKIEYKFGCWVAEDEFGNSVWALTKSQLRKAFR